MTIKEKAFPIQRVQETRGPAYRKFLKEGDRLYFRHLDAREHNNLLGDALNEYSRALEQMPDSGEVLARMAKIFLRQGNHIKAERYARKALLLLQEDRIPPEARGYVCRESCYVLGFVHHQGDRARHAMLAYHTAIRNGGLDTCRPRIGLFQTCLAAAKQEQGLFRKAGFLLLAIYSLLTAIISFPFEKERMSFGYILTAVPALLLAWAAEELGDQDAALARYLSVQRRYPGLASLGLIIGDIYREKGEPEKAYNWFNRVLAKHPGNLNAHYHMARVLEQREDYQGMAELYEKLTRLKPGDPHIHCNLANAYYYLQSYKEALLNYETAMHLGSEPRWRAMVAQSIGNIQADYLENYDAAIAYYEMAKALDPTEVENYIQLGLLYFQKEDFANAELVYHKALKLAPENPRLSSNIGYLRWMEGDIENAVAFYEQAISLDDSYEIPMNNLGVIYLDTLGQVHRAIELFRKAIDINENYALGYYNLGRAHSFLNNRLEAANCFQVAQDLNRFSQDLDNDELTERINSLFDTAEAESFD